MTAPGSDLPRRAALTGFAVALYLAAHFIPVPAVAWLPELGADTQQRASYLRLAGFGLSPWFFGYLLVELLALVVPAGRRLRYGGIEGRRRLNLFALQAGFALLVIAAVRYSLWVAEISVASGASPPFGHRLSAFVGVGLPLAVISFGAFLLSRWINERGVGNGFAVLLTAELLLGVYERLRSAGEGLMPTQQEFTGPLLAFALVGLIVASFLWRRPVVRVAEPALDTFEVPEEDAPRPVLPLPPVPTTILPLYGAFYLFYSLLGTPGPWLGWWDYGQPGREPLALGWEPFLERIGLYGELALLGLTITVLCWVCFHLFSSAPRLNEALSPQLVLPQPYPRLAAGAALRGTAVLVVGMVGIELLREAGPVYWSLFDFVEILLLCAAGVDLFDEVQLRLRQEGGVESILRLDNVHLAALLAERLRRHGIDALARGSCYRSLFFLFRPLVKIDLLVPAADAERAIALVEPERIRRL